jgi:MoaA/NifB/PqqE/SkfB family radical SAM enzyme
MNPPTHNADHSFPLAVGEVLGAWSVVGIEHEKTRTRVRIKRAEREVTLSVHPQALQPHRGPFDVGTLRIYSDLTTVPFPEFAEAGQALSSRLKSLSELDAIALVRSWAKGNATPVESFEATEDLRFVDEVEDHLSAPERTAFIRGSLQHIARTAVLARLAPLSTIHFEARLDLTESFNSGDFRDQLAILSNANVKCRLSILPTSTGLQHLGTLAVLAKEPLPASVLASLQVVLHDVPDYDRRGLAPPRLSATSEAVEAAGLGVSSRMGEPLCLFPTSLRRALVEGRAAQPIADATYGEACARCAVRSQCAGVSRSYVERNGTHEITPFVASNSPFSWQDKARWLLTNRVGRSIELREIVPAEQIPPWPCHLPWTRLEMGDGSPEGPCCSDYQVPETSLVQLRTPAVIASESPPSVWNGRRLRAFRREMARGRTDLVCKDNCPMLLGGTYLPKDLELWGGPPVAVENQIRMVEDMMAGADEVRSPPQALCISTTSFCNYNCLMCDCGERGTLDDEKSEAVWNDLTPWLDSLIQIDAKGGEPLASPQFRAFLERTPFEKFPQLGICLTTNGSYLTPRQLEKLSRVNFTSIMVSLNAVEDETYLRVNRGLAFERIRENIAALHRFRATRPRMALSYSMVVLRTNLSEVRAFAEMAARDGVDVRYLLPLRNLNDQSIMLHREAMEEAAAALSDVARSLESKAHRAEAGRVWSHVSVLEHRIAAGRFEPY